MKRQFLIVCALSLALAVPGASRAEEGDVLSSRTHVFWLQGDLSGATAVGYEEVAEAYLEPRKIETGEPRLELYDEKGDYVTTVPVKAPGISDQEIGLADEDGDAVRLAGRRFDIRVEAPSVDGASFGKGILYLNYLDPKTLDRGEVAITVGGIDPDSLGYLKPPRLPSDAEVLVLVDNGGGFLSLGTYDIVFLAEGFQPGFRAPGPRSARLVSESGATFPC